jgi:RNA-dependent RNA polymerase
MVMSLCRYKQFEDRFLRLNFTDETLGPLTFAELSPDILAGVRDVLTRGLDFAGSHYAFLAFSSSQLREHGAWMYCDPPAGCTGVPTAEDIRRDAGALSSIKVPAKWAARLGQCFSTTSDTIEIVLHEARTLPGASAHSCRDLEGVHV